MKLYDYAMAPNPRRVRIFLAEKGIEIPVEQVDLRERQNVGDDYLAINQYGTVPLLELDNGKHICESIAICRYFEAVQPDPALMGSDPEEQARIEMFQRLVELNGLMPAGEAFRNSHPAFEGRGMAGPLTMAQSPDLAERGTIRVGKFFEKLDNELKNKEFIAGDKYSIADITGLVAIDFAGWSKLVPTDSQVNLKAWYDRVNARPSAKA
jgi:glutathione S-transferase